MAEFRVCTGYIRVVVLFSEFCVCVLAGRFILRGKQYCSEHCLLFIGVFLEILGRDYYINSHDSSWSLSTSWVDPADTPIDPAMASDHMHVAHYMLDLFLRGGRRRDVPLFRALLSLVPKYNTQNGHIAVHGLQTLVKHWDCLESRPTLITVYIRAMIAHGGGPGLTIHL